MLEQVIRHNPIPREVANAYYPHGISSSEVLVGGVVNTSYKIIDGEEQSTVLQCLGSAIDERMAVDYEILSDHLRQQGWDVPKQLLNRDESWYFRDRTRRLWRAFEYIDSEPLNSESNLIESSIAFGGLLGRLHGSLQKLSYQPKFSLPHFHETSYYAAELAKKQEKLRDTQTRDLSRAAIALTTEFPIPKEHEQLIHGDPKLANALFRNNRPFTFIDFDTVMTGNPLLDVGDMVRSLAAKLLEEKTCSLLPTLDSVIAAYFETARPATASTKFKQQALAAGRTIAAELCIRYLLDSVDGNYFVWDPIKFASREDHNLSRARNQWRTIEAIS